MFEYLALLSRNAANDHGLPRKKGLRRSQTVSSVEFKLRVGKLRSVKEHEDELSLPFEPAEFEIESQESSSEASFSTKKLRSFITKGFLVDKIIKDIKRELSLHSEEQDELTNLPYISKRSSRYNSPSPPQDSVPYDLRNLSYKELNHFSLNSKKSDFEDGSMVKMNHEIEIKLLKFIVLFSRNQNDCLLLGDPLRTFGASHRLPKQS